MRLCCDNKSATNITNNTVQHDLTKYIEIDIYFINEKFDNNLIRMSYVSTNSQHVDMLTKGISKPTF